MRGLIFADGVLPSKIKKTVCVILALLAVIAFAACRSEEPADNNVTEETTAAAVLNVPYDSRDGLNPFEMTSDTNRGLVSLLHSGLYTLDSTYRAMPAVASDGYLSGLCLEITLGDVCFFDGRRITAEDVVYSFYKAQASPLYSKLLSGISGCTVKNPSAVEFTLTEKNINVLMSLTFPIVKKGTAEHQTSKPVGCGFYCFNAVRLEKNPYCGEELPADIINLVDISGVESVPALIDEGKIDFFCAELSGGETVQCASPSISVYLNRLLYIGLNGNGGNMGATVIRRAVSLGLDRRAIVESALAGNGRPAVVPFNTSWFEFSSSLSAGMLSDAADRITAQKLLEEFGIGRVTGVDEDGQPTVKRLHLKMIYPESNSVMFAAARIAADQLDKINVSLDIEAVPSGDYLGRIEQGEDYDMYIGEINISDNMDISALMTPYGNAAHGIRYSQMDCDEYYTDFIQGDVTIDDFIAEFTAEQPFIPIAFRNGKFFYSTRVSGVAGVTENSVYSGIGQWSLTE